MDNLSEDVTEQLQAAQHAAERLVSEVQDMLVLLRGQGQGALTQIERAQAFLALSHAVQAMHQLHLKTGGHHAAGEESVIREDKRLHMYTKKVNKVVTEDILKSSRPTLSLNVAAVNRFVEAAIPEQLTAEQKEKLRSATLNIQKRKAEEQTAGQAKAAKRSEASTSGPGQAKDAALAFLASLREQRDTEAVGITPPVTEASAPDASAAPIVPDTK